MVSILHPSRGRPEKSFLNHIRWDNRTHRPAEFILALDEDDPYLSKYNELYNEAPMRNIIAMTRIVENSCNVVESTNCAAKLAIGDILIYLSDDFDCPDGWANSVEKYFEGVTEPMMLKVDDCLQPFHVGVLTIPIMNRALYERLGYFWHPGYRSMFVDVDLYETCKKYGWLKYAPELKFPHNHCSVGKAPHDETYRRSEANWKQGQDFYNERKRLGFPL